MTGILFNVAEDAYLSRTVGVHRIAHFLREHGADIEVVEWANFWTLAELKELFVSRYSSDLKFIGFSHMFSKWALVLEEFCKWVKETYPTVKIISGSSSKPRFNTQYIDFYVMGFGEHATLELVKYIASNGPRPRFSLELANGKPLIDANASYQAYPMKSLMVKYQDRDFLKPSEWLGIETARGCKFQCAFCNFPVLGVKGDYTRDADDFELQLRDAYDRYGITNYAVADETFNDRTEKITKFANVVEKLPFSPWFTGFIRADLLHSRADDLPELARMNFFGHYYGIETLNTASGRAVGKGLSSDKVKQTLLKTRQYYQDIGKPYRGTVSLIVGLPHETLDTIRQTKQWLIDNWQGQAVQPFALTIPTDADTTMSLIAKDYAKYGYREITIDEIAATGSYGGRFAPRGGFLSWANDHMNIHQANQLVDELYEAIDTHDFRSGAYNFIEKSKLESLSERLAVSRLEFDASRISDISDYIHAKLSL